VPQLLPISREIGVEQSPFLGWTPLSAVHSQQLSSAVAPDSILVPWIVPLLRPARRSQRSLWASLPFGRSSQGFSQSLLQALLGLNCGNTQYCTPFLSSPALPLIKLGK